MTNREREVKAMADASMRALDTPEGEAILNDMLAGTVDIAEGMACLLVLSGEYEFRDKLC
jgi:hypothetical protein